MKTTRLKLSKRNLNNNAWGGALIFAVGIAVILVAIILGYMGYLSLGVGEKIIKTDIRAVKSSASSMQQKIQDKLPSDIDKMEIPTIADLQGIRSIRFGAGAIAEITISGKSFEMIYTNDPKGARRKYSKGTYEYNPKTGKITLHPSKSAGEPKAIKNVEYKILTMRSYEMQLYKMRGDSSLYFVALNKDIAAKSVYPLFNFADYEGAPVIKFSFSSNNK